MADMSQIGVLTAELMERIEESFNENHELVTIGVVAVVAEIIYKDEDGDEFEAIEYRCSDDRRWIQHGLFSVASKVALALGQAEDTEGGTQ